MKTTIDIPGPLLRSAKAGAAERGQSLSDFVAESLEARLGALGPGAEPAWMAGFGALRRLRRETGRVQQRIDDDLRVVESGDRA